MVRNPEISSEVPHKKQEDAVETSVDILLSPEDIARNAELAKENEGDVVERFAEQMEKEAVTETTNFREQTDAIQSRLSNMEPDEIAMLTSLGEEADKELQNLRIELRNRLDKLEIQKAEDDLENSADFRRILEEESLRYLQKEDKEWFDRTYSGIAPSGYLIDKKGKETMSLPSQNISRDYIYVKEAAKRRFKAENKTDSPKASEQLPASTQEAAKHKETRKFETLEASKYWTSKEWRERQRDLKHETYLAPDPRTFADIEGAFAEIELQNDANRINERSTDAPVESVDVRSIVRAPSFEGWDGSYHWAHDEETSKRGENAVIEIARKISKTVDNVRSDLPGTEIDASKIDDALEQADIFRSDSAATMLQEHEGPRGSIFFVADGSHRVAAAKLVGLERIRAKIGRIPDKEQAQKIWFESLALMPAAARNELIHTYDSVYPPTPEQQQEFDAALQNAVQSIEEIRQRRDERRALRQKENAAEAENFQNVAEQFEKAQDFASNARHPERFSRLRAEAALRFLVENAPASLWDEYDKKIDEKGYLFKKDGEASYTHATGLDIGDSIRKIMIDAVEAYRKEFPEET